MSVLTATASTAESANPLIGSAPPSPAGPVDSLEGLRPPPLVRWPRPVQVMWFGQRQWHYMFHHSKKHGESWLASGYVRGRTATTYHPDHARSLFKAPPDLVPTLAAESRAK